MSEAEEDAQIEERHLTLEQWLSMLEERPRRESLASWEFPTDAHRVEYLARIDTWSDESVRKLLRDFLLPSGTLGIDELRLGYLEELSKTDTARAKWLLWFTYYQRLLYHYRVDQAAEVWEGNTWVLDLLPHFPKDAIAALNSYAQAHVQWLPDARLRGLFDAIEVIRAKYIGLPGTRPEAISFLVELRPRSFECLIERLYNAMHYDTELTKPSKDGGRDIIARRVAPGMREEIRVECKRYVANPVGVSIVRALHGVVSAEKANKGVLVTTSRFTRGAIEWAKSNPRVEVIAGDELCLLLNEHLGPSWPLHVERLVSESERKVVSRPGMDAS